MTDRPIDLSALPSYRAPRRSMFSARKFALMASVVAGLGIAGYGLSPAQKIKICSDVIDSGSVKGLGLGLAYFNRGQALSNAGDPKGAQADYRMAVRLYTDVIRVSAPSAGFSRAMAARSSAMPAPDRDEVGRTLGKAAGRFLSAASMAAIRSASSDALTWSALVSTI